MPQTEGKKMNKWIEASGEENQQGRKNEERLCAVLCFLRAEEIRVSVKWSSAWGTENESEVKNEKLLSKLAEVIVL